MSNVYSLEDLRASLEKKYAPVEIDLGKGTVVLRNVLRLGKEERAEVLKLAGSIQADEESGKDDSLDHTLDVIKQLLMMVAKDGKGHLLTDQIGDDLALAMEIVNLWSEATQPGEAQNSPG